MSATTDFDRGATLGGLALHSAGASGERVLWCHPYTMDATVFAEVWAALPEWTHLGVDLPGHGRSAALAPGDDLGALGGRVAEAAARAGVRHVVGLSFGTLLALQVAIARPDAFAGLVLGAPALAGGPHDPDVERRYEELAALYRRGKRGADLTRLWMSTPPALFAHVHRRPALAARVRSLVDCHRWDELATYSTLAMTRPSQDRAALARVEAATLLVLGEDELPAQLACAATLASVVPRCEVVQIAGAGHLAMVEEPELAATTIEAHLEQATARRP